MWGIPADSRSRKLRHEPFRRTTSIMTLSHLLKTPPSLRRLQTRCVCRTWDSSICRGRLAGYQPQTGLSVAGSAASADVVRAQRGAQEGLAPRRWACACCVWGGHSRHLCRPRACINDCRSSTLVHLRVAPTLLQQCWTLSCLAAIAPARTTRHRRR